MLYTTTRRWTATARRFYQMHYHVTFIDWILFNLKNFHNYMEHFKHATINHRPTRYLYYVIIYRHEEGRDFLNNHTSNQSAGFHNAWAILI